MALEKSFPLNRMEIDLKKLAQLPIAHFELIGAVVEILQAYENVLNILLIHILREKIF